MDAITTKEAMQVSLVAAVFVITEVVKRTKFVPEPDRFMPLVALVVGFALGLPNGLSIIESILIGASASGLYDFGKKTIVGA